MRAAAAPAAADLEELTELYYAAEWGGRRDAAAEQRAEALVAEIKAALRGKRAPAGRDRRRA